MQIPVTPPPPSFSIYPERQMDLEKNKEGKEKSSVHPAPSHCRALRAIVAVMAPLVTLKSTDGHPIKKSLTFGLSDSKHFLQDDDKASQNRSGGCGRGEEERRGVDRRPTFFFQHLHSSSSRTHLSLRWLASLKKEPGGREKAEVRRTSVGEQ